MKHHHNRWGLELLLLALQAMVLYALLTIIL